VPRRDIAFDVDLGPGPRGAATAVYSRCRNDGGGNLLGFDGQFGPYGDASGCDLYRFSLAAGGNERRLHVRGEKTASEAGSARVVCPAPRGAQTRAGQARSPSTCEASGSRLSGTPLSIAATPATRWTGSACS
jgi:hypothetical protein